MDQHPAYSMGLRAVTRVSHTVIRACSVGERRFDASPFAGKEIGIRQMCLEEAVIERAKHLV